MARIVKNKHVPPGSTCDKIANVGIMQRTVYGKMGPVSSSKGTGEISNSTVRIRHTYAGLGADNAKAATCINLLHAM